MSAGSNAPSTWKRCNMCKKEIPHGGLYWVCSVSTCNRKRTGLSFCSVACWDAHVPGMNHRESWAEERRAPREGEPDPDQIERKSKSKAESEGQADAGQTSQSAASPPGVAAGAPAAPPISKVILRRSK